MTIVFGEKSTVAGVLFRCSSWIVLPDTDLTRPSTSSLGAGGAGGGVGAELPGLAGGGVGAALVELADALDVSVFALFDLLDVLHAATDNAVAPVTAKIAS